MRRGVAPPASAIVNLPRTRIARAAASAISSAAACATAPASATQPEDGAHSGFTQRRPSRASSSPAAAGPHVPAS